MKIVLYDINKCLNRKLIDVVHRKVGDGYCVDDSEEVCLMFSDGYEITIYVLNGEVVIEED